MTNAYCSTCYISDCGPHNSSERDMAMRRIFWGFCINRFPMSPFHYLSSCSDFGFKFTEILVIEKLLPDSPSWGVDKIAYRYNFFQTFKEINGESTLHPWLIFCQIGPLKGWFSH
jgi:hypothetical protein